MFHSTDRLYIVGKRIESISVHFFFSSRRRHTRYWRDWSSDVGSSDLSHQESTTPCQLHSTKSLSWNYQLPREDHPLSELSSSATQTVPSVPVVPQCEEAFNKAKKSLSSSHVLVLYNPACWKPWQSLWEFSSRWKPSTASRVFTDLLLNSPKRSPQFSPGYEDMENMFYFLNEILQYECNYKILESTLCSLLPHQEWGMTWTWSQ